MRLAVMVPTAAAGVALCAGRVVHVCPFYGVCATSGASLADSLATIGCWAGGVSLQVPSSFMHHPPPPRGPFSSSPQPPYPSIRNGVAPLPMQACANLLRGILSLARTNLPSRTSCMETSY